MEFGIPGCPQNVALVNSSEIVELVLSLTFSGMASLGGLVECWDKRGGVVVIDFLYIEGKTMCSGRKLCGSPLDPYNPAA